MGDHPERHLKQFTGILQADAYAGYNRLYLPDRKPGSVTEALCWSHAPRKFFVLADIAANTHRGKTALPISPIAFEAVRRIDLLFDIERDINGLPVEQRIAFRAERSAPPVAELEAWIRRPGPETAHFIEHEAYKDIAFVIPALRELHYVKHYDPE